MNLPTPAPIATDVFVLPDYPNYTISRTGQVVNTRTGNAMKPHPVNGISMVSLYYKGKTRSFSLLRLLALGFVPNPENLSDVVPSNGDGTDCRVENAKWVSHRSTRINLPKGKGMSSRYRGVTKVNGKWKAQLVYQGKNYDLGHYNSPHEAALAWNLRALELGYTYQNKIDGLVDDNDYFDAEDEY